MHYSVCLAGSVYPACSLDILGRSTHLSMRQCGSCKATTDVTLVYVDVLKHMLALLANMLAYSALYRCCHCCAVRWQCSKEGLSVLSWFIVDFNRR